MIFLLCRLAGLLLAVGSMVLSAHPAPELLMLAAFLMVAGQMLDIRPERDPDDPAYAALVDRYTAQDDPDWEAFEREVTDLLEGRPTLPPVEPTKYDRALAAAVLKHKREQASSHYRHAAVDVAGERGTERVLRSGYYRTRADQKRLEEMWQRYLQGRKW